MSSISRAELVKELEGDWSRARRFVIKLGTHAVMGEDGAPARERLEGVIRNCTRLWQEGKEILLVSSGAVGLGRQSLGIGHSGRPLTLADKQACAAVGQTLLMDLYRELFAVRGIKTAQVLLTAADFSDRNRYLTLSQTLERLLSLRVVPVINENDTVSTMELQDDVYSRSFGDNDRLSALVAGKLAADFLFLLTNVDGIFTENPEKSRSAQKIDLIADFQHLARISAVGRSAAGRGGMTSKLEAARVASISGVHTLVRSGMAPDSLDFLGTLALDHSGTWILARRPIRGKRRWIGFASGASGTIVVNPGAHRALVDQQASLLPIGISGVEGSFLSGQVVSVQDEQGKEVGRGITSFSAEEVRRIRGLRSQDVREALGRPCPQEVIHRDNLVIFEEFFQDSEEDRSIEDREEESRDAGGPAAGT